MKLEKDQLKKDMDTLIDRLQRKEDYWGTLFMKMFKAAENNDNLTELFKAECASIWSHLTSPAPTPHETPKKKTRQDEYKTQPTDALMEE